MGKGSSLDDIDPQVFKNVFVIGINDAELIGDVDLTIFHQDWVWKQIIKSKSKQTIKLTSSTILDQSEDIFRVPYIQLTQENSELMYQKLFSNSLDIEEVMFLTALRIAIRVSNKSENRAIYLVGFDFSLESGFTRSINPRASGQTPDQQRHQIERQEKIFLAAKTLVEKKSFKVTHVGYRNFSQITPGAFSEKMLNNRVTPSVLKGSDFGVLITAELTTNHLGDMRLVKSMMLKAAQQGADYVKFQMRDVDSFYSRDVLRSNYPSPYGQSFRDYRIALELSDDDFISIEDYSKEIGIGWFTSVLDEKSLYRAIKLGLSMIKLPGTISRKRDFLKKVAKIYKGDLVFSTGMTTSEYVHWLLSTFSGKNKIYLLHTNSAYPTPYEDCNISVVKTYAQLAETIPNLIPGYSSHDNGWIGSAIAVACGARMIEKHVKLGSNEWIHFDSVALDLEGTDFLEYVNAIRQTESILGDSVKKLTPSEHHKY